MGRNTRTKNRTHDPEQMHCLHCQKIINNPEKALFVEEEVGRIFCSEKCITAFFAPEIQAFEDEFNLRLKKHRDASDLSPKERKSFDNLRWSTLEHPKEIYKNKSAAGDWVHTLISPYTVDQRTVTCICLCLFLRGEPSFLFISFCTTNDALIDSYRTGEAVDGVAVLSQDAMENDPSLAMDELADDWREDETWRAKLLAERSDHDIPQEDFETYHRHLEEVLSKPDEVWSLKLKNKSSTTAAGLARGKYKFYHFLKKFEGSNPDKSYWYIIQARETARDSEEENEQLEVLDAYPTRDIAWVEKHRVGTQEVIKGKLNKVANRVVH